MHPVQQAQSTRVERYRLTQQYVALPTKGNEQLCRKTGFGTAGRVTRRHRQEIIAFTSASVIVRQRSTDGAAGTVAPPVHTREPSALFDLSIRRGGALTSRGWQTPDAPDALDNGGTARYERWLRRALNALLLPWERDTVPRARQTPQERRAPFGRDYLFCPPLKCCPTHTPGSRA
jgi:hypothetical protein